MAKDPGIGCKVMAEVVSVKGICSAGHQPGEIFEIGCHDPAGLCGFFYHDIFPALQCFQFGGVCSSGRVTPLSFPVWTGITS